MLYQFCFKLGLVQLSSRFHVRYLQLAVPGFDQDGFVDPPLSDPPSVSTTKAVASNRLTGQLFHLEGEPLLSAC